MRKMITLIVALAASSTTSMAQGASASASQTVVLTLSNVMSITFLATNSNTGNAVNIPFSTLSQYANGVASAPQQLKIQSNKAYNITVATNSPDFAYTGTATPTPAMPVSGVLAMQVSANGTGGNVSSEFNGTYASLSNTPHSLISAGGYGNNSTLSIQYEATPGMGYPSGSYAANVVYTASQP